MHRGRVRLYRCSVDNELYFADPFTRRQAWQDLLLNANHKNWIIIIRWNIIKIERWQIGRSQKTMQKRWKRWRTKIENFLKYLENQHQINIQITPVTTVVTVQNYDRRQTDQHTDQQTDKKQTRNRPTTNKNDKNNKEWKEEIQFDKFWDLYSRKIWDRKACKIKRDNLKPEEQKNVLVFIPKFLNTIDDKKYQPYPATFLNQRRWEDDLGDIKGKTLEEEIEERINKSLSCRDLVEEYWLEKVKEIKHFYINKKIWMS